jgi:hypothetical protein
MSAHVILIGEERASRARRSHSTELDRHSAAESVGRAVCPIECKVHSFCKALPQFENWDNGEFVSHFGAVVVI